MNIAIRKLYIELSQWRDDELEKGNMQKARIIHRILSKKRKYM